MHDHAGALILFLAAALIVAGNLAWLRMGRTLATHRARTVLTPLADVPWDQLRDEVYDRQAHEAARYLDVELWLDNCGRSQS